MPPASLLPASAGRLAANDKLTTPGTFNKQNGGIPTVDRLQAGIRTALARYGEVKAFRPVLHKGYGLSKFKLEMVLKQDITSRITVQGNAINVFYRNQPRSCFVCSGDGHEAKNCPRRTANKRAAPADTTSSKAPKAPRTFAAAVEPAADINPPAGTVQDQPAVVVLPPIQTETGDLSSDHPGPQQSRVSQPATDPPPAALLINPQALQPQLHRSRKHSQRPTSTSEPRSRSPLHRWRQPPPPFQTRPSTRWIHFQIWTNILRILRRRHFVLVWIPDCRVPPLSPPPSGSNGQVASTRKVNLAQRHKRHWPLALGSEQLHKQ